MPPSIDALLAMQGVEDPTERRKRSGQPAAGRALDVLDDLKIGLLTGSLDSSTVAGLRRAAANLKIDVGRSGSGPGAVRKSSFGSKSSLPRPAS